MSTPFEHTEDMNGENFQEMLESSMNRRDDFEVGAKVEGKIVFIAKDLLFVDISGKSEAVIGAEEFRKDDETLSVKTGDIIQAYVVSLSGGEIRLTSSIGRSGTNMSLVQMAHRESIPVYGTVINTVKGGYSVSVGGIKCFCPVSQIDLRAPSNPAAMLNRSFLFKIIEYKERGKNIIVSRTVLLDEQRRLTEASLRQTLRLGDRLTGTVSSVRDFGVFVDIGGMDALVPKSELSRGRRADMSAFKIGDRVEASVKAIDWDTRKLTLSIKDLEPEPWDNIGKYGVGDTVQGRVVNIIKTGAFVELEPGLDGFVHVSRMSHLKKIIRPEEAVSVGDEVEVRINSINTVDKKISLELVSGGPDPWKESGSGIENSVQTVTVEDVKPAGLGVRLENGMLGFIPRGELRNRNEAEITKKYAEGDTLKAAVLRIEQNSRKMILSEAEAVRMEERKDYETFVKKESASQSTTLGSLLKNKFEDLQKKIEK
jgi:small subunit ribosomal protein S1